MKYYILYNPLAGSKNCKERLPELEEFCGADAVYIDMTTVSDYPALFAGMDAEDVIVVCGGDGTLNRFINESGVENLENHVYYYAAGSGNDFLRDIPNADPKTPLLIDQYIKNLPTVTVNGKTSRFINGVGYGIDGYCCEVGDALHAKSDKPVNYTAIAIKGLLFGYKPKNATVTVDGVKREYKKVWIAPTMHGKCYGGGMIAAPDQDRLSGSGELSLVVFHGSGKLRTLMIFPSIFKGEHVKATKHVEILRGREITVEYDRPAPLQIDGETVVGVSSYTAKAYAPVTETV